MKLSVEQVAELCHEVNREFCVKIGDTSQTIWANAPDWQKKSAIDGVRYRLEHPYTSPEASHNNWLRGKKDDGWVYGPVKDPVKKEHPCMLPYAELPPEQRAKDFLFVSVVASLAYNGLIDGVDPKEWL